MPKTVVDTIEWKIYEHPKIVIPCTLTWTSEDPIAVKLSFHAGLELPVEWTVSRDLFHDAITRNTAGEGDVRVVVVDDTMLMTLDSPLGTQKFVGVASDVGMFLARTYGHVPRDAEEYDLDGTIAQILAEQA